MATLEDVARCPKCNTPGMQNVVRPTDTGGKVISYLCENELCLWYRTGWIVQIKADGSIAERTAGPKQFAPLTAGQETAARDYLRQAAVEAGRNPEEIA